MSRFDDELRRAAEQLADEPLPGGLLDEALDNDAGRGRWRIAALAVPAVLFVAVGAMVVLNLPGPVATESQSPQPSVEEPRSTGPSAPPSVPLRHEVERDGLRMAVELETERGRDGVPFFLTVTVENVGDEPRYWSQSGCEWSTHVTVAATPPFDRGRTWSDEAATELKRVLLSVWGYAGTITDADFTPYNFGPAEREPRDQTGCFMSGSSRDELLPGESVTDELVWLPVGPFGMPLPTHSYELTATFPVIPATGDPDDRDESDNVVLSVPFEVVGEVADHLMPGEAIDVILADGRLWQMLEGIRRERWIVPRLTYEEGVWVMWLPIGKPSAWIDFDFSITASVDARTGELLELRSSDVNPHDPFAEPSVPPAVAAEHTIEQDGLRLTVELDRDQTIPGHPIFATATIRNIGSDTVYWGHSSTCAYPVGIRVMPLDAALDPGRSWTGEDALTKRLMVNEGRDEITLEDEFIPADWLDFEGTMGCTSDLVISAIAPGEQLMHELAWDALGPHDMPLTGLHELTASFGYMSRGAPPAFDAVPGSFSVSTSFTVEVVGPDLDLVSPGVAFDALLDDPGYRALLEEAPRERRTGSDMSFADGRWIAIIFLRGAGDTVSTDGVIGEVDALTGEVVDARIGPAEQPPGG